MTSTKTTRAAVVRMPGHGRAYPMGRINSTFLADEDETSQQYSISEWWLEPDTKGLGAHQHPEDDVFYVLDGVMSVLVDDTWIDAPKGAFVLIPGGMMHDFENRGDVRAGVLNFTNGAFEPAMQGIAQWFLDHPPGSTREPQS